MRRNFQESVIPRGETFADRYCVEAEVGRGAYGVVYRAIDEITGDPVALKILRANRARIASERWREASALRRLRIPGVATLYDEGYFDGAYYVAMEFVDGEHFFEPSEPRSWSEIRSHSIRLLEILSVVHRQGIVHGDLKPANVMRVGDDVKLLDFGLAISSIASDLEAEMGSKGTPVYMAPELFRDARATPSTDLFAVGTMLFEALAGRPFFMTANFVEWVRRLNSDGPPQLAEVMPKAHPEAQILVDALLQRLPEDRPRSAAEALSLIERGRSKTSLRSLGDEPLSVAELTELFVGIEPGFHLRTGPAKELHERTGGKPDEVVTELDAWTSFGLAHHDGERFSVSSRALASLRDGLRVRDPIAADRVSLEAARVAGVLRFVGESTADELTELCDGLARTDIRQALEQLERLGAVRIVDGRVRPVLDVAFDGQESWLEGVARDILDSADDPEVRLRVARTFGEPEAVAEAAGAVARTRSAAVDTAGARSAFQEAWIVLRDNGLPHRELLRSWASFALESNSLEIVEEVLWVWRDQNDPISRLLEGYRLMLRGRNDRVVELLREIGTLAIPRFEVYRLTTLLTALSWETDEFLTVSNRAAEIIEANSDLRDLRDASRMREALRMYGEGKFAEAFAIHREVAETTESKRIRVVTTFHTAWSGSDSFEFELAQQWAERAIALAEEVRLPHMELLSRVAERVARYRGGELPELDDELIEAVEFDGGMTLRCVAGTLDAAICWRRGDIERALEIQGPLTREWDTSSRYAGLLLALVFWLYLKRERPRDAVIEAVAECNLPRLKAQMLGMMAPMVPEMAEEWRAEALGLVPAEHRSVRLEIMSVDEAVALR